MVETGGHGTDGRVHDGGPRTSTTIVVTPASRSLVSSKNRAMHVASSLVPLRKTVALSAAYKDGIQEVTVPIEAAFSTARTIPVTRTASE